MRFHGDGLAWHPGKGKIVAEFVGGEFSTDNPELIAFLKPMYKHDGEEAEPPEKPHDSVMSAYKRGRSKNA